MQKVALVLLAGAEMPRRGGPARPRSPSGACPAALLTPEDGGTLRAAAWFHDAGSASALVVHGRGLGQALR